MIHDRLYALSYDEYNFVKSEWDQFLNSIIRIPSKCNFCMISMENGANPFRELRWTRSERVLQKKRIRESDRLEVGLCPSNQNPLRRKLRSACTVRWVYIHRLRVREVGFGVRIFILEFAYISPTFPSDAKMKEQPAARGNPSKLGSGAKSLSLTLSIFHESFLLTPDSFSLKMKKHQLSHPSGNGHLTFPTWGVGDWSVHSVLDLIDKQKVPV